MSCICWNWPARGSWSRPALRWRRRSRSSVKSSPIMNDGFDSLLNQLEELGFYAYTDPTLIAEAKNRAKGVDFPYDDLTNRFYPADAENLAEGGVLDFVQDIRF